MNRNSEEPESELGSHEPPLTCDVAHALQGFEILTESSEASRPDSTPAERLLAVVHDRANASTIVARLFPAGVPLDQAFFTCLSEVRRYVGFDAEAEEAIGMIWSEAMRMLTPDQQQELLRVFTNQAGHAFFETIDSLPVVVTDHPIPADFLAVWFPELIRAVERDMAQDGVWNAVRAVCNAYTDTAIEVLHRLAQSTDQRHCDLACFVLGILRTQSLRTGQQTQFNQLEDSFRRNEDNRLRAVFNWSWATTARHAPVSDDQLEMLLSRADISRDDHNNIIGVVCRLLSIGCLSDSQNERCRDWVSARAAPSLPSEAKYHIARAAHALERKGSDASKKTSLWIQAIQPVPKEDVVTWERIGGYLCRLFKESQDDFATVFDELCRTSADAIHHLFSERRLQHLLHKCKRANIEALVADLALSSDTPMRRLGLYLFNELEIQTLPKSALESCSPIAPRLLFYEAQLTHLKPRSIARILAALVPYAEKAPDAFRDEFFDELKLQCLNFAGGCREELQAAATGNPLIQKALEDVSGCFKEIKQAHDEGVNAMEVDGYRRAVRQHRRSFSKHVSEGVKNQSIFLSMCKQVQLLYGRAMSQYIDGELHDATPLRETSTSMELPVVDYSDPEEMAIRRMHASAAIRSLLDSHHPEPSDPE